MLLDTIIAERLSQLRLFSGTVTPAEESVEEFEQTWRALGREILQRQMQTQVEAAEATQSGARQRRPRRYQSPLGEIILTRRVYPGETGGVCWADEALGLPSDGWFRGVKELASALGVSHEFAHATRLLARWSGVEVSEKTVANHVEIYGEQWVALEAAQPATPVCPLVSSVSAATCPEPERPILYIGADGIHTPMQQGGTREAKVGVLFWQSDHWQLCETRRVVRQREYVATLESVAGFRDELYLRYTQLVQQRPHQVVFLGDGAPWIWLMASALFPNSIQILDFFHVSEYLWEVARAAFPQDEAQQQTWAEEQQQRLKQSQWQAVITAAQRLPPTSTLLQTSVERLSLYLTNNQTRIDYQTYLQQGLMIGSGVVESSNRRIVTQRLKQSGMFWSTWGAQAVMALRAGYLSNSSRWHDFWYKSTPTT
jgi:hypothetical protein